MNKKLNESKENIRKKSKKDNAEYQYSIGKHYALYFLGCFMGVISPVVSLGIIWLFDIQSPVLSRIIFFILIIRSIIFTIVAPFKLSYRKVKPKKNKNEEKKK